MSADQALPSGEKRATPVNPYEPSFAQFERVGQSDKNSLGRRLPISILMALCGSIFGGLFGFAAFTLIDALKTESFSLQELGILFFSTFTLYLAYVCLAFAWRFLRYTPYRNGLYFSPLSIALFGLVGSIALVAMLLYQIVAFARSWF
ncbi:hypothetical protein SH467x_001189 [Pirellulaceae bacterium SH467]|jgi:hypothetical protein